MATSIQPTPTLLGKEAEAFWEKIANYDNYLKEKGIVLNRKKIEEESARFRELFKRKDDDNKQP